MNISFYLSNQNIYYWDNQALYPAYISAKYQNGRFIECYLDMGDGSNYPWYCRIGHYTIIDNLISTQFVEIQDCWTSIPGQNFLNIDETHDYYYHLVSYDADSVIHMSHLMDYLTHFVSNYDLSHINSINNLNLSDNQEIIHYRGKKHFVMHWSAQQNVLVELSNQPLDDHFIDHSTSQSQDSLSNIE